jgi:hypothetical protein
MSLIIYVLALSLSSSSFALWALQERNWARSEGSSVQTIADVKLALTPTNVQRPPKSKPYLLSNNPRFTVMVTNNSSSQIRDLVLDTYYQNRPTLYRNGELIPYRKETAKLVGEKDSDPVFVSIRGGALLEPATTTEIEELNLADWYEPLASGVYKLTNRHRFQINGSWTVDSQPLLFKVVEQQ